MTEKSKKILHRTIGITTSALLVLSGVLFIISCYSIYKSGASPFTRESIADSFSKIAIPVWITVAAVIASGVFSVIFPESQPKLKGKRTNTLVLAGLHSVKVISEGHEMTAKIYKEQKLRRILLCVNVVLLSLSATLPLIFLLNPNNFPAVSGEYNSEIARGMLVYLGALLPAFIYEIVYVILFDNSVKREIELVRSLPKKEMLENNEKTVKSGGVFSKIKDFSVENAKEITLGARIALFACAVCFIVAGIFNGGMSDVLQKAIKICTECIGLG